jgi:hypothetical protein
MVSREGFNALLKLVDDVDLVRRGGGRVEGPLAQVARVVDPAVAGRVDFDDVQAAGATGSEVLAGLALAARRRGGSLGAVEAAGQDAGAGRLAAAPRAAEQIGVVRAAALEGIAQRRRDVGLADDLVERRRAVAAVQGLGHGTTLAGRTDASAGRPRATKGPPAHPPEPAYPCCLPALGEFSGVTPREGSAANSTAPSRALRRPRPDLPTDFGTQPGRRCSPVTMGSPHLSHRPRMCRWVSARRRGGGRCTLRYPRPRRTRLVA